MWTASYEYRMEYGHDREGRRFPTLTFRMLTPVDSSSIVDVEAYLDCGAERSLFDGRIGGLLGIDLLSGQPLRYESATGSGLSANIHPVRLVHAELGTFDLRAGFTTGELRRNLLGRDFFNLVQIGFRENQLAFFVTPTP